jgi:hypothetical protein
LHWREFALGADRHRLEAWLATKPFHDPSKDVSKTAAAAVPAAGGKDTVTPAHALVAPSTPSATPSPSPARRAPTDYASQGSPLKHFVAADSD